MFCTYFLLHRFKCNGLNTSPFDHAFIQKAYGKMRLGGFHGTGTLIEKKCSSICTYQVNPRSIKTQRLRQREDDILMDIIQFRASYGSLIILVGDTKVRTGSIPDMCDGNNDDLEKLS